MSSGRCIMQQIPFSFSSTPPVNQLSLTLSTLPPFPSLPSSLSSPTSSSLPHSFHPSLPHSITPFLTPSLHPSLHPSIPCSVPPPLTPFLHPSILLLTFFSVSPSCLQIPVIPLSYAPPPSPHPLSDALSLLRPHYPPLPLSPSRIKNR